MPRQLKDFISASIKTFRGLIVNAQKQAKQLQTDSRPSPIQVCKLKCAKTYMDHEHACIPDTFALNLDKHVSFTQFAFAFVSSIRAEFFHCSNVTMHHWL